MQSNTTNAVYNEVAWFKNKKVLRRDTFIKYNYSFNSIDMIFYKIYLFGILGLTKNTTYSTNGSNGNVINNYHQSVKYRESIVVVSF